MINFLASHPVLAIGGATALAAGGLAGAWGYHNMPEDPQNQEVTGADRMRRGVGAGVGAAALVGGGLGAAGLVNHLYRKPGEEVGDFVYRLGSGPAGFLKNRAKAPFVRAEARRAALATLPRAEMSATKAAVLAYGGSWRLMGGAGAVVGAMVSASKGNNPVEGAAIGAGVGVGASVAMGVPGVWKGLKKIPGGRGAALLAGATTLLAGALLAGGESEPEAKAYARNDEIGLGGYDYSEAPRSGVKDRMASMNATGDLAFGLHNGRH